MPSGEIIRLVELLGQQGKDDPRVQAMVTSVELNPQNAGAVQKMLSNMLYMEGGDPNDLAAFPIVKELPQEGVPLGPVNNGRRDGPIFYIPEGTSSDVSHIGIFGLTRWGKTFILKELARHSMLQGNRVWIFDTEDEFSDLVPAVPESYKPVTVTAAHLRICFFQPPCDGVGIRSWLETISLLLRGETFIRDGGQNLFNDSLLRLCKGKGVFAGSNRFPSLAETLHYFQNLKLSGSEVRGKAWLESLINRMRMLDNTYNETSHVTSSDMLQSLANRSVIFRLQAKRGIPLQFLTNFLITWLAGYREGTTERKEVLTLLVDEKHLFDSDKGRNDIGSAALATLSATGAKRGLRLALCNQHLSSLDEGILGNIGCRIITRLPNPKCIWFAQQSMGLYPPQARRITQLRKREVIVMSSDHPTPFAVRVNEFTFPEKPDDMYLEKMAQDFLSQITWAEDSCQEDRPTDPEAVKGDALKTFIRIAEKAETIEERCEAIRMDRARELRARRVLEAKGYIAEEEVTLANKKKIYKVTPKGAVAASKVGIKVKRYKSGAIHEYLLNQVEKRIGALNTKFKFQRNSTIAREYRIQPDSVLNMTSGYRAIIEIVCTNVDREVEVLNKERLIPGVDMVIAIAANKKVREALERALEDNLFQGRGDSEPARLVVLDAECLKRKFDWESVFEGP